MDDAFSGSLPYVHYFIHIIFSINDSVSAIIICKYGIK